MPSDIEIAQAAKLLPIQQIAAKLDLREDEWEPYGRNKAKLSLSLLARQARGKLILVTAMSPTPAGEGKSTVTIGLGQALNQIHKNAIVCIREPSLGPNFGMKGGAAGGGYAQVVPMEDINLHFTGDFHAITTAHNLLAALIDNHIYAGNSLHINPQRVVWKRVLDMNDRSLRNIVTGLGGPANGVPREAGFDITAASEIMAIVCLVESPGELKQALSKILIGYTYDENPVFVSDLGAEGAMALLLKDAIKPNLVQTVENTPALVHGGPFGNIAHGCNSLMATKMALTLGDYVVTEAGFGADLGAEKFFDIKCRKGALGPDAAVLVATIRSMKYHGGVKVKDLHHENLAALERGFDNVLHHARIVERSGVPFVVALNHFTEDTEAEVNRVKELCAKHQLEVILTKVWAEGGAGGVHLAERIVQLADSGSSRFEPLYDVNLTIEEKIRAVVTKVYEGVEVRFTDVARRQLRRYPELGWDNLPICMAKTQYSFSDNPKLIGDPKGFSITIRDIRPSLGAGFLVCLTGDIMTMPGMPKQPLALNIDIDEAGIITGLS